jgi:heptose I phosphotransferase
MAKHQALLDALGLSTVHAVKAFRGELVKDHKGRRDIFRIKATADDGRPLVLFLKRNWRPYKKDGLHSLLRRGKVWSIARQEWENSKLLAAAGLTTAALVAYGEECGPLWERFSFLVTEAAPGAQTLEQFLRECRDRRRRRAVLDALAGEIRKLHDAGLAAPDLFSRHLFVDESTEPPRFCLIDMARLNQRSSLAARLRARDLAALNVTAPLRDVTARERLRFLRLYSGRSNKPLAHRIARRVEHLLQRRKFRRFLEVPPDAGRERGPSPVYDSRPR